MGNREVLDLFGFGDADCVQVSGFALDAASLHIGEDLAFSYQIEAKKAIKVRLEYGIDYVKANGKNSRKIFQVSELSVKENTRRPYTKTHSFADANTRKHYPGADAVTLIVNGAEQGTLEFEVSDAK